MKLTPEAKQFIEELKKATTKVETVYEIGKHCDKESMLQYLHAVNTLIRMVERLEDQ